MNTRPNESARGFTLVELLVVIAIIGMLAVIMVPALSGAFTSAEKRKAMQQAKELEGALRSYFTEYGDFPVGWAAQDAAFAANNGKLVKALLNVDTDAGKGKTTGVNYKGIVYLELDKASRETFDSQSVYLDPWGQPFEILLDLNLDDTIASGTGTSQTKEIKAKVGVQSSGPDKKYGTKDDIRTW